MATSYTDIPSSISGGYRDNPGRSAEDPPADIYHPPKTATCRAPPPNSFPENIGGINDYEDAVVDSFIADSFELVKTPYKDDPDSPEVTDDDDEPYSEHDIRYRPSPLSNMDSSKKKSLAIGIIGFALGIIVMIAFLSMTKGDRTGVRGSDDLADGLSIDPNDDYRMQGQSEGSGDVGEFTVYVPDQNQESSSEQTIKDWNNGELAKQENSAETIKEGNGSSNGSNGKGSEEYDETIKNQEPSISVSGESNQAGGGNPNEVASQNAASENTPNGPVEGPFCGYCNWKHSTFTCDYRVGFMESKFGMTVEEAQASLLNQGHCSTKSKDFTEPGIDKMAGVPALDDCQKRFKPGENTKDNFCSNCMWKGSDESCYKRIQFLVSTYGTPAAEAMQKEMERGNCMDDMTDAERAKLKEQGLDRWCDACIFNLSTCWKRVTQTGQLPGDDPGVIAAKLDLLKYGKCMMPPFCDEVDGAGN